MFGSPSPRRDLGERDSDRKGAGVSSALIRQNAAITSDGGIPRVLRDCV